MVGRYPNLKEEIGSSIPDREISSLLYEKLARVNCLLCYGVGLPAYAQGLPKKEKKIENEKEVKYRTYVKGSYSHKLPASVIHLNMYRACVVICVYYGFT